jgi:hypothetical protein
MRTPPTKRESDAQRQVRKEMLEYRKAHFAIETRFTQHPIEKGEMTLSVTTNGYQWQSISFLQSEIPKIIAYLEGMIQIP